MRKLLAAATIFGTLLGAGVAAPADATVVPNSANGCVFLGYACVSVNGDGTWVNWAEAYASKSFTGHFRIYDSIAGWSYASGVQSWNPVNIFQSFHVTINSNQPANSKICASAYNTSNHLLDTACETIER